MKATSNVVPPGGEEGAQEKRRTTKAMCSVAPPGGRKRPGAVVQSTSRASKRCGQRQGRPCPTR
eukprot:6649955-Pyramimonas_sp.AAC.1